MTPGWPRGGGDRSAARTVSFSSNFLLSSVEGGPHRAPHCGRYADARARQFITYARIRDEGKGPLALGREPSPGALPAAHTGM